MHRVLIMIKKNKQPIQWKYYTLLLSYKQARNKKKKKKIKTIFDFEILLGYVIRVQCLQQISFYCKWKIEKGNWNISKLF